MRHMQKHEPSATVWGRASGSFQPQNLDRTDPLDISRAPTFDCPSEDQSLRRSSISKYANKISITRQRLAKTRTQHKIEDTPTHHVSKNARGPGPLRAEPHDAQTAREARIEQVLRRLQSQQASALGLMEPGHLRVHPLQRHSPRLGHAYLPRQECGFGLLGG